MGFTACQPMAMWVISCRKQQHDKNNQTIRRPIYNQLKCNRPKKPTHQQHDNIKSSL